MQSTREHWNELCPIKLTVADVLAVMRIVREDRAAFSNLGQLECCHGWHNDLLGRLRQSLIDADQTGAAR